jgi:cytochrome P450
VVDVDSIMYRRCSDPRAYFAGLRAKGPIDTEEGFEGRLQVLTLEGGEEILQHPDLFSSGPGATDHGAARPLIPLQIDPPDHLRYRKLLDPVFAPRNVYPLEDDIVARTHRLIDRFYDRGRCDFTEELSIPVPAAIFLGLLGLPFEGLDDFLPLKNGIIRPEGTTNEERAAVRAAAAGQIYELFGDVVTARTAEPRDDLITRLINSEVEGEKLTTQEVLDICFLLLLAGLDTVSISLQCMLYYLATHPEHRRMIVDDPSIVPDVVEELLRWDTPVIGVSRFATEDVVVSGCPFPAGSRFQVALGSINTDPGNVAGYEAIDFHRTDNRHLAFGGGIHRCLGSHLARVELRTVLREWHRRIPEYEIEPGENVYWNAAMLRGIEHLPLVWEVKR